MNKLNMKRWFKAYVDSTKYSTTEKKNNQAEDASDITSADLPKLNQTEIYSRKI